MDEGTALSISPHIVGKGELEKAEREGAGLDSCPAWEGQPKPPKSPAQTLPIPPGAQPLKSLLSTGKVPAISQGQANAPGL